MSENPKPKPRTTSESEFETHHDKNDSNLASEFRANFATNDPPNATSSSSSNKVNRKPQSSPLLSSTPPSVSKALIKAYPYLLIINKVLSIATWTNEDYWVNVVILCLYSFAVLYFENIVTWLGHIIIVLIITLYALLNNKIIEETNLHPTLDDVVQALTSTRIKADMLLMPITSLSLTAYDIKRLLFTTLFLTPIYLIITFLLIKPRILLLLTGLFLMTYHSSYSIVIRRIIWKIKLARLICFYLTGLDLSQTKNHSLFAAAFAKVQNNTTDGKTSSKPVRFTYVIYENQRRWLGIGWTSNLLSYERTPWTDEFLNESSSIESFKLPNAIDDVNLPIDSKLHGADWKWVDKTWRLDLTNDGAITLPNSKRSKTTANPSIDEGYLYYDNVWKKPSTEDTFSKYTRRRRWIRTAELIYEDNNNNSSTNTNNSINTEEIEPKKKNLRFADTETEVVDIKEIEENEKEIDHENENENENEKDVKVESVDIVDKKNV
ncbi:uncharacterized protein KGF55_004508 [Candida pseudojiufengensis]|uniref:uncharacterized protein n=1 Tax=Candida pseudojiufengensis TaxID=497109 RepID=UPI0022248293|nr:uncharacterized protein KGF55_004508 [Candida pseudojiufengensis]KAI5960615.1 hypothetical protein KGF55_004508 [Candida pseudojiufengensis]